MKLYSDFGGRRALQIASDLLALAVIVVGMVAAAALHDAIAALGVIGMNIEQSGSAFAQTMGEVGDNLAGVPLIGGSIRGPFDAASDAGGTLADAGVRWQNGVANLANTVGWTVAVLVLFIVALAWVLPRTRGVIHRSRVARLAATPSSMDLLAIRALATQPAHVVADVDPQVVAAWRRGDPAVIHRLAALELQASGIKLGSA